MEGVKGGKEEKKVYKIQVLNTVYANLLVERRRIVKTSRSERKEK